MRNNVRDAALAPFCYDPDGFPPHRHSTIAINEYPSGFEMVEIGWRKEATVGEPIYSGFWKWFVNGSNLDDGLFTTTCCGWRRFKEYKQSGSSVVWQFRYDNNNDGVFETNVGQVETFGLIDGMASGETGRRGGSGTNAYDHFDDLKRTTSTSGDTGWTAWSGNTWWKGCIPAVTPAYKWDWMLQIEYQIIAGTPCHP